MYSSNPVLPGCGAAKLSFDEVDSANGAINLPQLQGQVRGLEARTGARVAVFDEQLKPVVNAEIDPPLGAVDALRAAHAADEHR